MKIFESLGYKLLMAGQSARETRRKAGEVSISVSGWVEFKGKTPSDGRAPAALTYLELDFFSSRRALNLLSDCGLIPR